MNTRASVAYGWGVLIAAGGGAYWFAKRSINADRSERASAIEQERQRLQKLREMEYLPTGGATRKDREPKRDPSVQNNADPAPVAHEQESGTPRSKYEASAPFRSRKGDRFS